MAKWKFIFLTLFLVGALGATAASAVPIYGTGTFGQFTGDIAYDSALGQLTVSLTNTTPNPPYTNAAITAFVLNNPDFSKITSIIGFSFVSDDPFADFGFTSGGLSFPPPIPIVNDSINAAPFGLFDFAASIWPDHPQPFLGAGSPATGIHQTYTGTFTFTFDGPDPFSLTTADFLNATTGGNFMVVRFKGIEPGDYSDKVPAVVPITATLPLLGSGLLGVVLFGARRRS